MARGLLHPLGAVMVSLSLSALPLPARAATPQVVAVDGTLCDITRRLAAGAADVTCLIPPGGDPHAYRLKPSDRQKLAKASLVVHVGFGLTPAVSKISSSAPVVAIGELALKRCWRSSCLAQPCQQCRNGWCARPEADPIGGFR